jgi:hypothetical protein
MNLTKLIQNIFCSEVEQDLNKTKTIINDLNNKIDNYDKSLDKKIIEINKLKEKLSSTKWKFSDKLDKKYPEAKIYYKGRSFPFSKELIEVPVNVLITPNDPAIKQYVEDWKVNITRENYETEVVRLWHLIHDRFYRYDYDKNVWGASEVWEFPFETLERMKENWHGEDCDSWAIFQTSFYIAAGLNPSYVRAVAGMTSLGGHATVYVFSEKDKKFHHLNSTYGTFWGNKLSDFPTHKDARKGKDRIGIKNVWFSFNNLNSWHTFKTDADKKSFKKEKDKNIIIR